MSELKFNRVNNEKYATLSINIEHAYLKLREDYDIIKIEKNKMGLSKSCC